MARFPKSEMLNELRTIFLFEADHILMGSGPEVAAQFIGFDPEFNEYCHLSPERVDLSRFSIAGSFERGYDYAFRPSLLNTLGEGEVQDLVVFMLGTPRAGGISSGGETHAFMTPEGLCQRVADTVLARWKLEWDPVGAGSHSFTTRESGPPRRHDRGGCAQRPRRQVGKRIAGNPWLKESSYRGACRGQSLAFGAAGIYPLTRSAKL